jgi:cob(I)alamin adenosyltransferase
MGHRLSRIVTRTGDDGTTGLGDGRRVPKDAARIEACGSVDELSCAIGVLLSHPSVPAAMATCLVEVQHDLFDLGSDGRFPSRCSSRCACSGSRALEHNAAAAVKESGSPVAQRRLGLHLARAICRRAERRCWALARQEQVGAPR